MLLLVCNNAVAEKEGVHLFVAPFLPAPTMVGAGILETNK